MTTARWSIAMLAAGALTLGVGVALAAPNPHTAPKGARMSEIRTGVAQKPLLRNVRGEVTAVDTRANPPTLVVEEKLAKNVLTVGVDVSDKTIIREGKLQKTLADIKVGDRVWMQYKRTPATLVADEIHILKPAHGGIKG